MPLPDYSRTSTDPPALTLPELEQRLRGTVLRRGEKGYEEETAVYNTSVPSRPAIVVTAADAEDVREAVSFAARQDRPIAVQATGHGATVAADEALLINTRRMNHVEVFPDTRTARVGAGALWRDVIVAAAPHGLAPLNGSSETVGVVGYTLGGGLGLFSRKYGYAADHVHAMDVVTADGELVRATPHERSDLFWALRGGKGNFGVVTSMEFSLFPAPTVYAGGLIFPGEASEDVLRLWHAWTADCPEDLTSSLALLRLPDAPPVPEPLRGRLMAHLRIVHLGSPVEGERLIAPFREMDRPPVVDTVREMPYAEIATVYNDPADPSPYRQCSLSLARLDHDTVDSLLEIAGPDSDCTDMIVELRHLGGALTRPPRVPNAVGAREAEFTLTTLSFAPPGSPPPDHTDTVLGRIRHRSSGSRFVNFLSGPEAADLTSEAFDVETFTRLSRIKNDHDPRNLFRVNHNVPPVGDR
ncbi:FAD-binding oxidoreductase [Nocardiopsis sp. EMB25]|uniref:FAD-binding oxidoreductase n=1 Tax=Nocardiopsis sp. EMB25 TaxID=2835867 RepID=UPI00228460A2|nr:FAD-binding oxidoreductase [Nocardiopsis sp. EMB25]MCY9786951.1 FAD-binding oxidoreductase [Nocardiopsis sp. EMB25]